MSTFDIYTFQFTPIVEDGTLPFQDIEEQREHIMNNKNLVFEEVLTSDLFTHHSKTLPLETKYSDKELTVFRIANRKEIEFEQKFKKVRWENQPSCVVIVYNNAEIQRIAIEQKADAFTSTGVVAGIMSKAFNAILKKYDLSIKINKEYYVQEFWNLVNSHEYQITKLRFEFNYPNLSRVNEHLNIALGIAQASKSVDSTRSMVEFNTDGERALKNINEDNTVVSELATGSAQGGTPIKLKVKGYRKYLETGNAAKTVELEEIDLIGENAQELKDILKELKE